MRAPELLFDPKMNNLTCASLPDLIWEGIQKTDIQLLQHVILAGGSTMFKGMKERMIKELDKHYPCNVK